jgi:hypothetical protein
LLWVLPTKREGLPDKRQGVVLRDGAAGEVQAALVEGQRAGDVVEERLDLPRQFARQAPEVEARARLPPL